VTVHKAAASAWGLETLAFLNLCRDGKVQIRAVLCKLSRDLLSQFVSYKGNGRRLPPFICAALCKSTV